jgi:hypothetical protein
MTGRPVFVADCFVRSSATKPIVVEIMANVTPSAANRLGEENLTQEYHITTAPAAMKRITALLNRLLNIALLL